MGIDGGLDLGVGVLGGLFNVDDGLLDLGNNLGSGLGDDGEGIFDEVERLDRQLVNLGDVRLQKRLKAALVALGVLGGGGDGRAGSVEGVLAVLVGLSV